MTTNNMNRYDVARQFSEIQDAVTDPVLTGLVQVASSAIYRYLEAREDLKDATRRLQSRTTNLLDKLENGYQVSELDEIQGDGCRVDRLCALVQDRLHTVKKMVFTVRLVDPAIADQLFSLALS